MRKLDGLRGSAGAQTVDGGPARLGLEPGRALSLEKIEILQRGSRDQRAVDGMKRHALLERVRRRLAFQRLGQLVLGMRQRVQLRRLLRKQHDNGE